MQKICLVTGASKGIGRAAAHRMSREGCHVIVSARSLSLCMDVVAEIKAGGGAASHLCADVTDGYSMDRLRDQIQSEFGRLDYAFLNAGSIAGGTDLQDVPQDIFDAMMDVNAKGVYLSLKAILPMMVQARAGSIVVTSAGSGLRGRAGVAAYAASKWAAIGLAQSSAMEVAGQNVRVNVIAPGYIASDTWMSMLGAQADDLAQKVPMKRLGRPEDVADVVAWFLSENSRYVTGAVLPIDGGLLVQ